MEKTPLFFSVLRVTYRKRSDFFELPVLYYKILISSRAATISWWDRRFACQVAAMLLCGAANPGCSRLSGGSSCEHNFKQG
jgi:hypothetical protein